MKKAGIVLLSFLFAFILILSPAKAADAGRYGYSLLTTDIQRSAYNEIVAGLEALKAEIPLSIRVNQNNYQAITDEVMYAIKMVIKDWPEFFWFTGAYRISISGAVVTVIPDSYSVGGQVVSAGSPLLAQAQNQIRQAVDAAKATIPANASDYEIALALHDYLVDTVRYEYIGDHQTAYGALVGGKAVCAGYARAYQLLLNEAGIPCSYICGRSLNPYGMEVAHAWNLVWLDGKCYYTDVTWDDQAENGLFHEYLNLSLAEISKTHFADPGEVLPSGCGHDDYRFFVKNSGKGICDIQDHKDDADVADCFELKSKDGRNVVYYCTIHYHKDDFAQWFAAHYEAIGEKLGLESFDCDLVELGHEHHVVYTGVLSESAPEPSVPSTDSTESSQTQPPTQAPTTLPSEASTQPAETATQSAAPTEPSVQPTDPVETTAPTDPTQPAEPTDATEAPSEPEISSPTTQPTDTGAAEEDIRQTGSSATAATETTSEPSAGPEDDPVTLAIVGAVVLLGGAAGAVSYFLIRKKKS